MGSVLTEVRKCDTWIRTDIGLAMEAFENINKLLINGKESFETKKGILDSTVTFIRSYGKEWWSMSAWIRRNLIFLQVQWRERLSKNYILKKMSTERTLRRKIRKRHLNFLKHIEEWGLGKLNHLKGSGGLK